MQTLALHGGPRDGETRSVFAQTWGLQFAGWGDDCHFYVRHPGQDRFDYLGGADKAEAYRQHLYGISGKPRPRPATFGNPSGGRSPEFNKELRAKRKASK